jgi:SPP1 gp7 family putative phage head morphogenesis protein
VNTIKLIEKVTSWFRGGAPAPQLQTNHYVPEDATPYTHNTEEVDETLYIYKMFQVEADRRAILRDVEQMLANDPLIDETNARIGRKAVRGGIFVTVVGSGTHQKNIALKTGKKPGYGSQLANRAQVIIDNLMKRCKIDANAVLWVSRLLADGDLFLNIVVEQVDGQMRIKSIRWIPTAIMKRNEDQFGQFIDPMRAFSELDLQHGVYFNTIIPENAVRHFPLWAVNHIRWKYRGGLYGNSQYASIRKVSRQNISADDDMVVRRKVRAPLRRAHIFGTKDNPGNPDIIKQYKEEHRDAIVNGKYKPVTDYYMNGLGDIKNLEGDGNLDKIGDIKFLYDKEGTGTIVPKGLVGHAEDINRDVLDDQKDEYMDTLEDIRHVLEYGDGGPYSGLRAIIDFELLLHGIDVETTGLTYDLAFMPLRKESPKEAVERTGLALKDGTIDRRTAVTFIAPHFNVENPDFILRALEEEATVKEITDRDKGLGCCAISFTDTEQNDPLKGIEKGEKEALKAWKKRFNREWEAVKKLKIPIKSSMSDAEDDEEQVYLDPEGIDDFVKQVAKIQKGDRGEYVADLQYVYTHSGKLGGTMASARVGLNFKLYREDIFDDLLLNSGTRIKDIDDTTLENIRVALAEGYVAGSKDELVELVHDALGKVYACAYQNRADMIARTESMWAYNRSSLHIYDEAGVETFEILVTGDERTCPKCKGFIGKTYTRQTLPALPNHPRCRCVVVPLF